MISVRRNRRGNDTVDVNMSPMVDMTFLLLIFFLVTSSFRKPIREWDINLPESTYAAKGKYRNDEMTIVFMAKQDAKSGRVQVWKNLVYAWSKTADEAAGKEVKENISETELRKVFFQAQGRMTRPTVRLEIDRSVPYFAVAEVLDSLYSFNLRDISFRARDR